MEDISDEGPALDPACDEAGFYVCGALVGRPDTAEVARWFVRAGWRSRSSSWHGYEVETAWCRVELDPGDHGGPRTLLNGVIDPARFDTLVALLSRFGLDGFGLELYDADDVLLREIDV
ncbi:hypothetical protein [Streptomyces sp. NPDC058953]|uniref:hypothetical protein n=1 Tax=unclassified Streptomyces TaxID=2593676 RepID=UPI00367426B6